MCDIAGSPWGFAIGGIFKFAGVALLIRGLSTTRRSFDPEWEGIPTWLTAQFQSLYETLRSAWRRLVRGPRVAEAHGHVIGAVGELEGAGEVRSKKTPSWDTLEPMEAIKRVHTILYEERDGLIDRIRESEQKQGTAVDDEARLRAQGDEAVRSDVVQLALGGLAQEAWATVLILVGIAVTTVAGVCSVV